MADNALSSIQDKVIRDYYYNETRGFSKLEWGRRIILWITSFFTGHSYRIAKIEECAKRSLQALHRVHAWNVDLEIGLIRKCDPQEETKLVATNSANPASRNAFYAQSADAIRKAHPLHVTTIRVPIVDVHELTNHASPDYTLNFTPLSYAAIRQDCARVGRQPDIEVGTLADPLNPERTNPFPLQAEFAKEIARAAHYLHIQSPGEQPKRVITIEKEVFEEFGEVYEPLPLTTDQPQVAWRILLAVAGKLGEDLEKARNVLEAFEQQFMGYGTGIMLGLMQRAYPEEAAQVEPSEIPTARKFTLTIQEDGDVIASVDQQVRFKKGEHVCYASMHQNLSLNDPTKGGLTIEILSSCTTGNHGNLNAGVEG